MCERPYIQVCIILSGVNCVRETIYTGMYNIIGGSPVCERPYIQVCTLLSGGGVNCERDLPCRR